MIYQCSCVLRELRKLSNNTATVLAFLSGSTYICLDEDENVFFDYSNYKGEIHAIIDELVNTGYLTYETNKYYFCLTERGLHPYQLKWMNIKAFLFKSILVPIIVSGLTSLLTWYINTFIFR